MGDRACILRLLILASSIAGGCSDDPVAPASDQELPPVPAPVSTIRIVSGDQQRGTIGEVLPAPLVLQLLDSVDQPVPNQLVAFDVIAGGGTVSAALARSNTTGLVQQYWRLGSNAEEPQVLLAKLVDPDRKGPLVYTTLTAFVGFAPTGLRFRLVQAGGERSCGLTSEGQAYCWGDGSPVPTPVTGTLSFAGLATGLSHTCGLTPTGSGYCWGSNTYGQVGNGTRDEGVVIEDESRVPKAVSGGLVFRLINAGSEHTCALTEDGDAYCWGGNSTGALGDGSEIDRLVPTPVTGDLTFQALALGDHFSCGLSMEGNAYCWGSGLGDGKGSLVPAPVPGGHLFAAISTGFYHACGLLADGRAYCWGQNTTGELGNGNLSHSASVPVEVAGTLRFSAISAGYAHTCALTLTGALACWGWDDDFSDSRDFNNGTSIQSTTPVLVPGGLTFVALSEGSSHGCGVRADDAAYCWFDNISGALGNGTFISSYQPVAVR